LIHKDSRCSTAGAVPADIGHVPAWAHELGAHLERLGHTDRLDHDVRAESVSELVDDIDRSVGNWDGHVGAELQSRVESRLGQIDSDDVGRAEQPRGLDRGQADRSGADDGDRVARRYASIEHTDLIGGRHDVGEHQRGLVGDVVRQLVQRPLRERYADVLGLRAVNEVAEDPATSAEALPVAADPAVAAPPARGDAGHQHSVARRNRADRRPDLFDSAHSLVTEDAPVGNLRHVTLEDVQVGAADGHRVDSDDRVLGIAQSRLGDVAPGVAAGAVVGERLHDLPPIGSVEQVSSSR
jgi:hypothetical protein